MRVLSRHIEANQTWRQIYFQLRYREVGQTSDGLFTGRSQIREAHRLTQGQPIGNRDLPLIAQAGLTGKAQAAVSRDGRLAGMGRGEG